MQPFAPQDFVRVLQQQMIKHVDPSLYTVSMDHCPSEQLDKSTWHTTALILSSALEHSVLARRLAKRLRPKNPVLMKWKNATRAYRRSFLQAFLDELQDHPAVCVFAVSAKKPTISQSVGHFIDQLGVRNSYRRDKTGSVAFGPFVRGSTKEPRLVTLSENRAIMCLFVAHFVHRMHHMMHAAANSAAGGPCHVNWNFFGDKFPGPQENDMDLMFRILSSVDRSTGRIAWGYFKEGGQTDIDLLVDNLAGALDAAISNLREVVPNSNGKQSSGIFYWEQWS